MGAVNHILKVVLSSWLLLLLPVYASENAQDESTDLPFLQTDRILLQGLDKVTARVFTVEAKVNQPIKFGTLLIFARKCFRTPPEEPPESVCFLEIYETKSGAEKPPLFKGWMFASSPAASALEHPVYDVWVKEAVGEIKEELNEQ